jgi:hypothetical protein
VAGYVAPSSGLECSGEYWELTDSIFYDSDSGSWNNPGSLEAAAFGRGYVPPTALISLHLRDGVAHRAYLTAEVTRYDDEGELHVKRYRAAYPTPLLRDIHSRTINRLSGLGFEFTERIYAHRMMRELADSTGTRILRPDGKHVILFGGVAAPPAGEKAPVCVVTGKTTTEVGALSDDTIFNPLTSAPVLEAVNKRIEDDFVPETDSYYLMSTGHFFNRFPEIGSMLECPPIAARMTDKAWLDDVSGSKDYILGWVEHMTPSEFREELGEFSLTLGAPTWRDTPRVTLWSSGSAILSDGQFKQPTTQAERTRQYEPANIGDVYNLVANDKKFVEEYIAPSGWVIKKPLFPDFHYLFWESSRNDCLIMPVVLERVKS